MGINRLYVQKFVTGSRIWIFFLYFILISNIYGYNHRIVQRLDGWYNNLGHPSWGSADSTLIRLSPAAYADGVYQIPGQSRPNPQLVSNGIFKGRDGLRNERNLTALFAFFGQVVAYEIMMSNQYSCPIEIYHIPVDMCTNATDCHTMHMPFSRAEYDKKTGNSPNSPREQLNKVTSWIDGSFVYSTKLVWLQALRTFTNGTLESSKGGQYPALNTKGVPMFNFYAPHHNMMMSPGETFMLGDPRANENPPLLAYAILFLRWHNWLATNIKTRHPNLSDQETFSAARRWVVATLQNIIAYEYIPALIGEELEPYTGYNPDMYPGVSHEFQSAAFRYGHSLIPPGIYLRDGTCKFRKFGKKRAYSSIRLCNTWWDAQKTINDYGVEEMIMGLASQMAERDDHIFVSDLREKLFGPREFSRQDLVILNIMRGRDSGLPDYNTMRSALNLNRIKEWGEINTELNRTHPEIIQKFARLFDNDLDNVDAYAAGMLEANPSRGPGPLFKRIIKAQFERIRNSDRFWFENPSSGIFNPEEIEFIKTIKLYDIIVNVTSIGDDDIQRNVFHWMQGDPCEQPSQLTTKNDQENEPCGYVQTYDYFKGNELCYILTCVLLALSPIFCGLVAYAIVRRQSRRRKRLILDTVKTSPCKKSPAPAVPSNISRQGSLYPLGGPLDSTNSSLYDLKPPTTTRPLNTTDGRGGDRRKSSAKSLDATSNTSYFSSNRNSVFSMTSAHTKNYVLGYEWLNDNHRRKIMLNLTTEGVLEVLNRKGMRLKKSTFQDCHKIVVEINENTTTDPPPLALIRNFDKYDLLLEFATPDQRDLFVCVKLVSSAHESGKVVEIIYTNSDNVFECAQTKERKQEELDYFFKKVYAETFKIDDKKVLGTKPKNKHRPKRNGKETAHVQERDIMKAKLNKVEFADALGMKPSSLFVERMFAVIDKRKSNHICFQDFLDMTFIFANGSSEQKLRIMFDMFDINQTGQLPRNEFYKLLGGFIECEQADQEVEECLSQMMKNAGLESKRALEFEDFVSLMSDHKAEFNSCGIHFKGAGKLFNSKAIHERHDSFSLDEEVIDSRRGFLIRKCDALVSWIEENRQNIFYLIIFYAIVLGLFSEKMFRFCLLLEHTDLRRVMGAGICVSRASASVISFVYCVLLLTVCRHLITKLRETSVKKYVPLDSALAFHKLCAYTGIIFVVIHCAVHLVNLYHISTQPLEYLKCLFKEMFFKNTSMPPPFSFWAFQTVPGLTGIILTLITVIMYVFAHQVVRRKAYRYFWATHKLFIPFFILNILHGSARLSAPPTFHLYLIVPAILYTIDKLISLNRKYLEMAVIKSTLLPSDVTRLVMNRPPTFTYKSGQWVQISIPDINPGEYHAFTLTSAPHQDFLSLHIKALGRWTWKVRNLYDPNNIQGTTYPRVYIDGPYGDGNQDWPFYEVAIMISGGIGVTPYASILNDMVHSFYVNKRLTTTCKKVYFLWVCPSHKSYEWFINVLQDIKEKDIYNLIDIHIFITQYFDRFDLRTTMLYICDKYFQNVANKSMLTGLKATNHFGRPEFGKIFRYLRGKHKKCKKIGVFSCGPVALTSSIERSCDQANKCRETPLLVSHYENFG